MIITVDKNNYNVAVVNNLLGYYGEKNSRYVYVNQPEFQNGNCSICFLLNKDTILACPIEENKALIPNDILKLSGKVKCQWIYEYSEQEIVIKSPIFNGLVLNSVSEDIYEVPEYVPADNDYQKIIDMLSSLPIKFKVLDENEYISLPQYDEDTVYFVTYATGETKMWYTTMATKEQKTIWKKLVEDINGESF